MNSPDHSFLASFIKIDKQNTAPVYIQVAQQIINAIQRGILPSGTALPGSRPLSKLLHLHRSTVVGAFDELGAPCWLEIRSSNASFVLQTHRARCFIPVAAGRLLYAQQPGFRFRQPERLTPP